MAGVSTWEWVLGFVFLVASAFCSGTETALTALGDARARQVVEAGGRRARLLVPGVRTFRGSIGGIGGVPGVASGRGYVLRGARVVLVI